MTHSELLKLLLPPTSVDRHGRRIGIQLQADGAALDTALARAADLLVEADPGQTSELLYDWERNVGLPDPCVTTEQSSGQRRDALLSKLTTLGGQSRQYMIDLADAMGYPGATIDEFRPFTCNSACGDVLNSPADRAVWRINLPAGGAVYPFTCNSSCGDALGSYGDEAIECRINHHKPANTLAIFAYV